MLEQLSLTPGQDVVFSAGSKKVTAAVEKNSFHDNVFIAAPHTMDSVCLRGINQPLAFYYLEQENALKTGPVVGILSGIPVMLLKPEVISLYETMAKDAQQLGILFYVFTPNFIDFNYATVNGFYFRTNRGSDRSGWVMQEFPLPDVIYNQVGYISDDLKPMYSKLLRDYLKRHKAVRTINPFFALNDKWVTYDILSGDRRAAAYLPASAKCNSTFDVLTLLEKYGGVYLKPTVSSLGRDIYRVSAQGRDRFIIESHLRQGKKITDTACCRDALREKLEKIITLRPYLVQQSLDLIRYEDRPVDFRVHLFKDHRGCWNQLAVKARLGPANGVITGPDWGGLRLEGDKLLEKIFSRHDARYILGEIKEATPKLAGALERLYAEEFGEMGFDMAVTGDKRVWMIEVNPKPNWNVPPDADAVEAEKKLVAHFFGYCRYLLNLNAANASVGRPVYSAQRLPIP